MEVLDGGEWSATWPYRFTMGKPFPGTLCVGGWSECLRAGLETITLLLPEMELKTPGLSSL
jgi:hypothetical protein